MLNCRVDLFSGLLLPYCRRFSHTGSDFPGLLNGIFYNVCSCVLVQLRFPQFCSMGSCTCVPVVFYSMESTACALLPQAPSSTLCTFRSCVIHNVFVHCACVRVHSCSFVYTGNFELHYFCRRPGKTYGGVLFYSKAIEGLTHIQHHYMDQNYAICTSVKPNQRTSCCQYKTP